MPDEMAKQPILIAAGGTGGHLFPAQALGEELVRRGRQVALVTDKRVGDWTSRFPGDVYEITAGTVTGSGVFSKVKGLVNLALGTRQALALLKEIDPAVVVGFGGYPTVPPIAAALIRKIPTMLHEANAVMGRANRFLAPRVTRIATGFPLKADAFPDKTVLTGNPVRRPVLLAAEVPFPSFGVQDRFHLLVFGGSQGARVMSDVVPGAIQQLPEEVRSRLHITQQAREEDIERVRRLYAALGVAHELEPFFSDLPHRIADAHLVIGRAGASTVSELAVIGRPSILVPLPGSLDQDQAANAEAISAVGGALAVPQTQFRPAALAETLTRLAMESETLAAMARAARSIGMPDAASRLASEVLSILEQG